MAHVVKPAGIRASWPTDLPDPNSDEARELVGGFGGIAVSDELGHIGSRWRLVPARWVRDYASAKREAMTDGFNVGGEGAPEKSGSQTPVKPEGKAAQK